MKVEHTIERVAQAIHEAEHAGCGWDDEPASRKERFREYARNAINLLDEDIDVLLLALKEASEERVSGLKRSPDPLAIANSQGT
jgi:hypothetical protein